MGTRSGRELYATEERYQSVVTAMAEGVILQDADSVILACNEAAERLLGLSADQMMGRTSLDPRWRSVHEDGSPFPGEMHPVPVTLRTGEPQRDVVMGVHKPDGSVTWLSINSEPLFRPGETRPHAAVCTFTDITRRKQAEDALKRSEARYRRILETTLEGVWMIDLEGNTTYANQPMADMLACSLEELMATNMWDFIEDRDRDAVTERLAARARGIGEVHDIRLRRKDGRSVWTSMATSPITQLDGTKGALAMVRDVTAEREMEAELVRSRERLQQTQQLESIGRLAGGIAHDFNNLLTAILASVSFAQLAAPDDENLDVIRTAAERAADLTRQLLAFARKQVIDLASLDLESVVGGLARVLRRLVGEDIALAIRAHGPLWTVRADASQLEQVIVNLVVNAREAMPDGGPLAIEMRNVTVDARESAEVPAGEYVTLAVSDAGTGIDEAALPHIFEPFFSTKRTGTGLGLASCYGIVQQLGGQITVRSAPGSGTTFTVYLPRADTVAEPAPAPAPRRRKQPSRSTILLVEDDELLRRVVQRGLRDAGYSVLVAADGNEALALAAAHQGPIQLLVTDVVMPRMSGRQLAEALAPIRPETKVLYVSGYTDQIIAQKGVLEPGQHFLAKPCTLEALEHRIGQLLDSESSSDT